MIRVASFLSIGALVVLSGCFDKPEDPNKQLTAEVAAIDEYLRTSVTDYVAYDQSGIRLVIHNFGELPPPQSAQTIKATVVGSTFPSGTVFTDTPINSLLSAVEVQGLRYGLSSLLAGSSATIYIPSEYGFGESGNGSVPPNTTLVYQVVITEVIRTATQQTRFEQDTATIHDFIKENAIANAVQHPSGIWYTIESVGDEAAPKVYDAITFEYEGSFLSNGTIFDSGTLNRTGIFGLIDGLKVGLPLLREGGEATFYIPSGLGYGTTGTSGAVPPNANLKFKVKLTDVVR